jgi:ribosome recycling factor
MQRPDRDHTVEPSVPMPIDEADLDLAPMHSELVIGHPSGLNREQRRKLYKQHRKAGTARRLQRP